MSDPVNQAASNRRRFFAHGARIIALGGFTAFAAAQEIKRRRLAGDPDCIRLNTCADCIEFSAGCVKPKADSFRQSHRVTPG